MATACPIRQTSARGRAGGFPATVTRATTASIRPSISTAIPTSPCARTIDIIRYHRECRRLHPDGRHGFDEWRAGGAGQRPHLRDTSLPIRSHARAGVDTGLIGALRCAVPDLWLGVGDFKEVSYLPHNNRFDMAPYHHYLDMTDNSQHVADAVSAFRADNNKDLPGGAQPGALLGRHGARPWGSRAQSRQLVLRRPQGAGAILASGRPRFPSSS